jgi:hypothetical protein
VLDFKVIKIAIRRSYANTYGFLADARNFSVWGGGDPDTPVIGLGGNDWLVQVDGNKIVLRYAEPNPYGILDYRAFRQGEKPGAATPVRLNPNQDGCELVFAYYRRPGHSDEQFASGAEWLESDLLRLKVFLEKDDPEVPMLGSTVIGLGIERPVADAYRFLIEPRNFTKWAALTGHRYEHIGGRDWVADTAAGTRIVRFGEPNGYGVVDHAVFAEDETPLVNPMRVVANEEGTLLTYTCFQRPGMSAEKFASTVEWLTADLLTLKTVLEL